MPYVVISAIIVDNRMTIISIQIGKKYYWRYIDWGSGVSIITKELLVKLGLPKPNHAPHKLKMGNHTMTKIVGLVKSLKILNYGIPFCVTLTIMPSTVLDPTYSMLLGVP
jgi:hypothetical protein